MKKRIIIIIGVILVLIGIAAFVAYRAMEIEMLAYDPIIEQTTTAENEEPQESTIAPSGGGLYYEALDDSKKEIYDRIYKGASRYVEEFYLTDKYDDKEIFKIYEYVLYDHPEIFWTKGGAIYSDNGYFTIKYICTREEATKESKLIKTEAEKILSTITTTGDDYDTALEIYNYLAESTTYDKATAESEKGNDETAEELQPYGLEGVLLNHSGVCSGYAKAYQYLLDLAGIRSAFISGFGNDDSHAWLVVELDGDLYYSDVTWGDQTEKNNFINHYYFAMDTDTLLRDHTIDEECDIFTCSSTTDDYMVKEGLLLDTYDYENALNSAKAVHNKYGYNYIELRFGSDKEYKKAYKQLIDNSYAYDFAKLAVKKPCTFYVEYKEQNYIVLLTEEQ